MRSGRQGFALVLVLLAAAAAFALAMQGAVVSRASMLEGRVIHDRLAGDRDARSAVIVAISGLFTASEEARQSEALAEATGSGDKPDAQNPDKEKLELPPILRDVLGKHAEDINKKAKEQEDRDRTTEDIASNSGLAGQSGSTQSFKVLQVVGLPPSAVELRLSPKDSRVFSVKLWDASGQISINAAEEAQLSRFFVAKGIDTGTAQRLAEEIADWRDEDNVRHALGAEEDQYRLRGIKPRNGKFLSLEELLYLPSMTRERFDLVRMELNLGGEKHIHIGSCSREVLLSLPGVGPEFADRVMRARADGAITDEWVKRNLPIAARNAEPMIRTKLSNLIAFSVEVRGDTVERYEGAAVVGDGGLKSVALRPM